MAVTHPRGLLDTSVVVALSRLPDEDGLPARCLISALTLAELSVGPLVARTEPERASRLRVLQQAEADFQAIPFDDRAARAFGGVAAQLRSAGRKPRARAFDALIAATALANGLPVYTGNADDFADIDGLTVVAVQTA